MKAAMAALSFRFISDLASSRDERSDIWVTRIYRFRLRSSSYGGRVAHAGYTGQQHHHRPFRLFQGEQQIRKAIISKSWGRTPLAFITERRVQRAMPLLAEGDISIAEACVRVGFVSPAHFTRVFRHATGMNPSEYRASAGK